MNISKFTLTDRVVLALGLGSIGKTVALTFADVGADVVAADLFPERAETIAANIRNKGRKAISLGVDCTVSGQVNNMVDRVVKEFGRIDVLVNCTGGPQKDPEGKRRVLPLLTISEQDFDYEIAHNLKNVFLAAQAVARVMVRQKKGAIVNVNGAGGHARAPWHRWADIGAYKTAQAGSVFLTEAMAAQWGQYGIRVNQIGPRLIRDPETPEWNPRKTFPGRKLENMIPLGHVGVPEDIAWAAVFLASDAAEFITGEIIRVDGGPDL